MPLENYYTDPQAVPNHPYNYYEDARQAFPSSVNDRALIDYARQIQHEHPGWKLDPAAVTCQLAAPASEPGSSLRHLRFSDPVVDAYAQAAYHRAAVQLTSWRKEAYPEDRMLGLAYPEVDPAGKYCAVDMALGSRMARLKAASALCDPQRRDALNAAFHQLEKPEGPLAQTVQKAGEAFEAIRETERAAKLCPHAQTGAMLSAGAKMLTNENPAIQELDRYYTALEHIAGIKRAAPTAEVAATAKKMGLDRGLMTTPAVYRQPDRLNVEFQNYGNTLRHQFFANPKNWNKTPEELPREPSDSQGLSAHVSRYAQATVGHHLSLLYGNNPEFMPHAIVIDGQTLDQRMKGEYDALANPGMKYSQWREQNTKRLATEYVSSALTAGKQVHALLPDGSGLLTKQATQFTASGYTPDPMQPVTMNAWERFWSRCGFYKEKVNQINAYNRQQQEMRRQQEALEQARACANPQVTAQRIRETNINTSKYDRMFFGNTDLSAFKASLAPDNGWRELSDSRSSYASLCVLAMAAEGYPVQEIMNPNSLVTEKRQMGQSVLAHIGTEPGPGQKRTWDPEWLARKFFAGQQALCDQIDTLMKQTDPRDMNQFSRVLPAVTFAGDTMFDAFQDISTAKLQPYYEKAAKELTPPGQSAAANQNDSRVYRAASAIRIMSRAAISRAEFTQTRPGYVNDHLVNLLVDQHIRESLSQHPDKPFSQQAKSELEYTNMQGMVMCGFEDRGSVASILGAQVSKRFNTDPTLAADAANGKLIQNLKLQNDKGVFSVVSTAPQRTQAPVMR